MSSPPTLRLLFSTCPDPASAARIAQVLVEERLAACVSRLPGVHATYRWQDVVEQAEEVLLLIKTAADRIPALQQRLCELHPFDLPELIELEVAGGLPAYLQWVYAETREEP
ncbi:divalent-cation tolerance protein CutA [Xanthomonas citri pv. citri]|uniref:divalent-cation tolerance protein CutA n=1 Tax=Xanthomonas citri TaxID=346 RepID=UPI0016846268|nr:divalent-cation tolerance protein CutA [Xanthomonas citri]MBD1476070.1 divalent-cation tolerance protein CutA [Xanthomonas citri pv. citri]